MCTSVDRRLPSSSVLISTITRWIPMSSAAGNCVNLARYSCPLCFHVSPEATSGILCRFSVHPLTLRLSIFSCFGDSAVCARTGRPAFDDPTTTTGSPDRIVVTTSEGATSVSSTREATLVSTAESSRSTAVWFSELAASVAGFRSRGLISAAITISVASTISNDLSDARFAWRFFVGFAVSLSAAGITRLSSATSPAVCDGSILTSSTVLVMDGGASSLSSQSTITNSAK